MIDKMEIILVQDLKKQIYYFFYSVNRNIDPMGLLSNFQVIYLVTF